MTMTLVDAVEEFRRARDELIGMMKEMVISDVRLIVRKFRGSE